jgi:hypothetical protein
MLTIFLGCVGKRLTEAEEEQYSAFHGKQRRSEEILAK